MADCACSNFPASLGNVTFGANVGIGTTAPPYPLLVEAGSNVTTPIVAAIGGSVAVTSGTQVGLACNPMQSSSSSGSLVGLYARVDTAAAAVALAEAVGALIENPTVGAGSAIANAVGLLINSIEAGATNYSIYSAGGQPYFADKVGIGNTSPAYPLDVNGNVHASALICGSTTVVDSGGCYYAS